MSRIVPTIGRIVWYVLSSADVTNITERRRRVTNGPQGNPVYTGDVFPAMVVKAWGSTPEAACNLKVFLDGPDDEWVTSRTVSDGPVEGCFHWMPYQLGQAAKEAVPA